MISRVNRVGWGFKAGTNGFRNNLGFFRCQSFAVTNKQKPQKDITNNSPPPSELPFNDIRHSELFGQVVRSERYKKSGDLNPEQEISENPHASEETKLHPLTIKGRADRKVTQIPEAIADTINNNLLRLVNPARLRERSASIFQLLQSDQIQKAPSTSLDSDAHIASLFLQDFAHVEKVLTELKARIGHDFSPESVLDIGYGPATGMVALNSVMGPEFYPKVKDAYIVGRKNSHMKRRAKLLLLRQVNELENAGNLENPDFLETLKYSEKPENSEKLEMSENPENPESLDFLENLDSLDSLETPYIGPVDTNRLKIKTRLCDSLSPSKRYDLIIINQALLTREYSFPRDVDVNLEMVLPLLSPNGHLVLVERGNALGFEVIARARQVMIRPENYSEEVGKIPRPYLRGSTVKPQKLRHEDQIITEEHVKYEEELLERLESEEISEKISEGNFEGTTEGKSEGFSNGGSNGKTQGFSDEGNSSDKISEDKSSENSENVNYHLSIVAPCPHHRKCPLQLGDPTLYKVLSHKHRFSFCSFNNLVHRPKYTMELKRGKQLATQWNKHAEDGFGFDKMTKKELKDLEGSGRRGSGNTESGNFSYLIVHRSANDSNTIANIEKQREYASEETPSSIDTWPRVLDFPEKVKKNVKFHVCAPSGNVELWQVPRSSGKDVYHDARKLKQRDLWPLGRKTCVVKNRLSDKRLSELKLKAKSQKKHALREQRRQQWKKLIVKDPSLVDANANPDEIQHEHDHVNDLVALQFELSRKYHQQSKKFD